MNQLLQNEAVQAALITLIVVGLNALVAWVKSKTKGSLVEANWCYLQPIVAAFIKAAQEAVGKPETGLSTYNQIIANCERKKAEREAIPSVTGVSDRFASTHETTGDAA